MVAGALLDQGLGEDAGLAAVGVEGGGAVGGDADLGRTVAAKDGAVVDEGGFGALAGGGNGGAEAGQAATANDDIKGVGQGFHFGFRKKDWGYGGESGKGGALPVPSGGRCGDDPLRITKWELAR